MFVFFNAMKDVLRIECFDIINRIYPDTAEVRKMTSAQIREKCCEKVKDFNKFDDRVLFDAIKTTKQGKRIWIEVHNHDFFPQESLFNIY